MTPDFLALSRIEEQLLVSKLEAIHAVIEHADEKGRSLEGETILISNLMPNEERDQAKGTVNVTSLPTLLYPKVGNNHRASRMPRPLTALASDGTGLAKYFRQAKPLPSSAIR